MKFLDVPIKVWVGSIFATSGLALTVALFMVPANMVATVALTAATIMFTILVPIAIIRDGQFKWWRVLIGAAYGLLWPFGVPIVLGVALSNLIPDEPETQNEVLPEHNQGSQT
jgi:Ca2+/Na+ antiporter